MLNMSSTPHHHIYSTASGTPRPTSLILPPSTTSSFTSSVFTPGTLQTLVIPGTPNSSLTMTPNTIKSIEQSILQTLGEDGEESYYESQQYTGNFVPPLPSSTSTITLVNTWQGGQVSSEPDNLKEDVKEEVKMEVEKKKKSPPPKKPKTTKAPAPKKAPTQKEKQQKKTRSSGGPQPTEEEERRRVRRERNKQAAARCRKRRLDHTNKLVNETEGLEAKKRSLQTQITELQTQKEELEFILEAHNCVKKVKSDVQVLTDLQNLPRDTTTHKLKRPNTLNVNGPTPVTVSTPGIPINTPSNGIAGLGFEPLCGDWGVNTPTPVGETAAQQGGDEKHVPERDLSSKYKDLVTPVNPYKKLQDL